MISSLVLKNIKVKGKRTSIRLEPQLWDILALISKRENKKLEEICNVIDGKRVKGGFTSSVRVYVVEYLYNYFLENENKATLNSINDMALLNQLKTDEPESSKVSL